MTSEMISKLVRAHILAIRPPEKEGIEITAGSPLVATGILDSVGVFSLVAFLEERFGIEVPDEELEWKSFETVEAITRLVESKLAGPGAGTP